MYHEEIEDHAKRLGVLPIEFEHPALAEIDKLFAPNHGKLTNLILTGTAGDGKSRLLYQFWRDLGGNEESLADQPKQAPSEMPQARDDGLLRSSFLLAALLFMTT